MKIILGSALILVSLLVSVVASAQSKISREEYIKKYKELVLESQEVYGIPASIKMAQAILESDNGNSRLARQANNHFGIKCKKEWEGETINHDDDAPQECFRKYSSAKESFRDHSQFLDNSPRYQDLFSLDPLDYKAWAYGLKAAGYATNPKYPEILIKIIEDFQLYTLDRSNTLAENIENKESDKIEIPVSDTSSNDKIDMDNYVVSLNKINGYSVYTNNGSEFVFASEGDTYERIAKAFGVSAKRIRDFNDVDPSALLTDGQQVYVKRKAKRANNGKLIHVVKQGDSMHSISQQYGIRLKSIARMNNREKSAVLNQGQQIRLM